MKDRRPKTEDRRPKIFFLVSLRGTLWVSVLWFLVTLDIGAQDMEIIDLPKPKLKSSVSVEEAIVKRRSVRSYSSKDLTISQISQLLWACQGITSPGGLRAAPSAGALYPLEVYLFKNDGIYHYLPRGHKLEKISDKNLKRELAQASWNQQFVESAAIDIVICAVYERITSRYGQRGIRYADIEIGHAAQNIHLEAVSLGLTSVPVGAFDDNAVSKILNLKKDEKPIYIIPIGYRR